MRSPTSLMAEQSIAPVKKSQRQRVFEYIKSQGKSGATDEEVQDGLSMNPSTVRPRRIELERQGRVQMGTAMRKTKSGRLASTWVAL